VELFPPSHQAHNSKRSWLMKRIVTFLAVDAIVAWRLS
jgi:hypothetical protein